MTERSETVKALWAEVNRIACETENAATIRNLIAEAGIEPGVHVGAPPETFTPQMVGEWVLGQWADMIDHGSPLLNTARNISLAQWEKLYPAEEMEWDTAGWHAREISGVIDSMEKRDA